MEKFGKSVLFCAFIFIVCPASSQIIFAQEKIIVTIAVTNRIPFHGDNLRDGGPATKAIVYALERLGYGTKVVFYPLARSVKMAEDGEVDILLGSDYRNPEREKHFLIGECLFTTCPGFVKMKERAFPYEVHPEDINKTYRKLTSYRIGVMRGYTYEETFDTAAYLNKDVSGEHIINNLEKLIDGRIDLAVMDKADFERHMIQPDLIPYQGKIEFMEPPLAEHPNHCLVSRKSKHAEEILKAMNEGIRLIKEDGNLKTIMSDMIYQTPLKWSLPTPTEDEIKFSAKIASDNQMKIRRHAQDKYESVIGYSDTQLGKMRKFGIPERKEGYTVKITKPDFDLIIVPTLYIKHEYEEDLFNGCCDIISTVVLKKNKEYKYLGHISGWLCSINDYDSDGHGIPRVNTQDCGCNDDSIPPEDSINPAEDSIKIYPVIEEYSKAECEQLAWGLLSPEAKELHSGASLDIVKCKVLPDDPGKIIVVLFYGYEGQADANEKHFDVEILIGNYDGEVFSRLYQKDAYNQDEGFIFTAGIDTARYWLAPGVRAFGVTVPRSGFSHLYSENNFQTLRLYTAVGKNIVQVMDEIVIDDHARTIDYNEACDGETNTNWRRVLSIGSKKNQGYADIIVNESKNTKEVRLVKGKCKESDKKKKHQYILHFDGKAYSIPAELSSSQW